jgi:hypothetical protein
MTSIDKELSKGRGLSDAGQKVDEFDAPDLSPQEYAEHTAQQTAKAFEATKLVEIVEVKAGIGQIHLLARVKKDNERAFMEMVVAPVLHAMEGAESDGFVGKQFFLKNGSVKYGWVISFASNNLRQAAYAVGEALEPAIPRLEVMEAPLVGQTVPQSGGPGSGRKGAAPLRG